MVKRLSSANRTYTLRNAAAVVFALTAVLPLLLFTYTLYALNKLHETQAQIGLGVALFFALIGGFIFTNLMGRLAELLHYIEEQAPPEEPPAAAPSPSPSAPASAASGATPAAGAPAVAGTFPGPRPAAAGATPPPPPRPVPPLPRPAPTQPPGIVVPGLGTITARRPAAGSRSGGAFDEVQKSMWQAEAKRHLGERVLVSVKNAPEPIPGNLAQIAEDGVLLEQNGQRVAISYLRITNIERDSRTHA